MRYQQVIDFAKRYTEAWCSQDAASVAAFFATNGSLSINDGAPAVGREAITEVAQSFMTAFPDLRVAIDFVRMKDACAEYRWILTGTNTGPGGTGHRIRIGGHETWRFGTDDLIIESFGYFNASDYQRQLESGLQMP